MTEQKTLDCIELNPQNDAQASVIWLHGLGATQHDFVPVAQQLRLSQAHDVRFIFPQAPSQAVTINGGVSMPSWFDITGVDFNAREDTAGIQRAQQWVNQLIAQEVDRGMDSRRIILAGFSQGGALVLQAGLRYHQALGGIIALSCYLPLANSLATERHPANQQTPILWAHGQSDSLVPLQWADMSCTFLENLGYHVTMQTYPMEHEVCGEEIITIDQWINNRLTTT